MAEQLVTVKIDDDVQGGKLTTSATLSDGGTLSVNDEHDVTVTPAPPECSDESIDWTTAATEEGWSCAVDGTAYEYADFHILTTDGTTNVCSSPLNSTDRGKQW